LKEAYALLQRGPGTKVVNLITEDYMFDHAINITILSVSVGTMVQLNSGEKG